MNFDLGSHGGLMGQGEPCRLVVRKEKSLSEILQFSTAGLEIGQQVVIMAGPTCLKDIAHGLSETGLKTDALLHSGRLVFLTAPNCLAELLRPSEPLPGHPVHPHVFLDLGNDNEIICPYCSTLYRFAADLGAGEARPPECVLKDVA